VGNFVSYCLAVVYFYSMGSGMRLSSVEAVCQNKIPQTINMVTHAAISESKSKHSL